MADTKEQLIRFLERRAWNPVLKASPEKYPQSDRKLLERLKQKTEAQRERYRSYKTAGEVRQEFQDDLTSRPAKQTSADLKKLGLPTQSEVADEFLRLADKLGVGRERMRREPHKPHPPHPWHKAKPEERAAAKRALIQQARRGDPAAIETMKKAPEKWARDMAAVLAPAKKKAAKAVKKTAAKKTAAQKRRAA